MPHASSRERVSRRPAAVRLHALSTSIAKRSNCNVKRLRGSAHGTRACTTPSVGHFTRGTRACTYVCSWQVFKCCQTRGSAWS